MPVGQINPFFDEYRQVNEQDLIQDLICEAVSIYGMSSYYIGRTYNDYDSIYGTDAQSSYTHYWSLAVYPKNVLGFTGDKEFMSKFAGLEIRDQMTFSIPRYTFNQVVSSDANFPPLPNNEPGPADRPREGDLIFLSLREVRKVFQIKYVNLTDMFFQLGKLYTWEVTCELFEYSGETFNTGNPIIDRIQVQSDLNILHHLLMDVDGTPLLTVPNGDYLCTDEYSAIYVIQDNENIEQEANNYIYQDPLDIDPFISANGAGGQT